jgi:hypothetical protein
MFGDTLDALNDTLSDFNKSIVDSHSPVAEIGLIALSAAEKVTYGFGSIGLSARALIQGLRVELEELKQIAEETAYIEYGPTLEQLGTSPEEVMAGTRPRKKEKKSGAAKAKRPPGFMAAAIATGELDTYAENVERAVEADTEYIQSLQELQREVKGLQGSYDDLFEVQEESYQNTAMLRLGELQQEEERNRYKEELHYAEMLRLEEQLMREEMGQRQLSSMETMLGAEAKYGTASYKMWKTGWKGKADVLSGVLGDLSVLMESKSRAMFRVGKAAAIAGTITETASAAMKAYSSLAGIPYVGPFLGAAAAVAAAATGAIKIRQIRATQFDGGGEVGGAASIGSPTANAKIPEASQTAPSYEPTQDEQAPIEVMIYLKDDATSELFDHVVRENENARADGRQGFASERRIA